MFADVALEGKHSDTDDVQLSPPTWQHRSARSLHIVMSTWSVYPRRTLATGAWPYHPRVESSSSRGMAATSRPRIAGPSPALTSAIISGLSKYVVAATIALA